MQQRVVAVTGANGFIGLQIVQKLLNANFKVVATVRDANNSDKTKDLRALNNNQNLSIVSADLFQKKRFQEIFKDVNIVVHNASPLVSSDKEDDFVKPALAGAENVMESILSQETGKITNVIFISSMAAVCGAPGSKPADYFFSEKDWSDPDNQRERKSWYALSKTLAEQKVLSYEQQFQEKGIHLTRICPTLVLGPLLQTDQINASVNHITKFITGEAKEIPNFAMSLIDVRDVAELVYQSIAKNASGRYIGVQSGYTMEQIVEYLRTFGGVFAKNVPTKLAEGDKAIPSNFDLERTKQLIGREMITGEEIIKSTIESLINNKLINI